MHQIKINVTRKRFLYVWTYSTGEKHSGEKRFQFYKGRGISLPDERLLAFQQILCSIESLIYRPSLAENNYTFCPLRSAVQLLINNLTRKINSRMLYKTLSVKVSLSISINLADLHPVHKGNHFRASVSDWRVYNQRSRSHCL